MKRRIGDVEIEQRESGGYVSHVFYRDGERYGSASAWLGQALWQAAEHLEALQAVAEAADACRDYEGLPPVLEAALAHAKAIGAMKDE